MYFNKCQDTKGSQKGKNWAIRQKLSVFFYQLKIEHGVDTRVRLRLASYLCEFDLFLVPESW